MPRVRFVCGDDTIYEIDEDVAVPHPGDWVEFYESPGQPKPSGRWRVIEVSHTFRHGVEFEHQTVYVEVEPS